MPQTSCGLLLFDRTHEIRVLLAHPGGPFFARKDAGVWTIPKGLAEKGEPLLDTAKREFAEETGYDLSSVTDYVSLETAKLKSGKLVHAWAFEGHWEAGRVPDSNSFEIEWPPRSGRKLSFPEIDKAEMFTLGEAREKINLAQAVFLDRLRTHLDITP